MKKLVVGSFAFVLTLMLSASVFAQTYDITEYCGANGLINRGNDPISGSGNVLNVKNDIKQEPDETGYIESNYVLGDYQAGNTTINGNGHKFDGNGYGGFKMSCYHSGEYNESTIKNATLTNYSDQNGVIYVGYNDEATNKLNLIDVDIINSSGAAINVSAYSAEVDVVSKNKTVLVSSNTKGIVNNGYLNFKGDKIIVKDNISGSGNISNTATLNLGGDNSGFSGYFYVKDGTVNLLKGATYFAGTSDYNNGTLNTINDSIDNVNLGNLSIAKTMKLNFDVDLAGVVIDSFTFSSVEPYNPEVEMAQTTSGQEVNAKISLNKINLLSDSASKVTVYEFGTNAEDYIQLASSQKEILGPIFTYKVSYGEQDKSNSDDSIDNGTSATLIPGTVGPVNPATGTGTNNPTASTGTTNLLQFERMGGGDGEVNLNSGDKLEGPLNPVLLQSKVAVAASSLSQEEVFDTVLNNAGNYTFFQKQGTNAGDVEDRAAPTLWIKAFGSQEDLDMEDYTKIKTTYYGAVVGLDWDRQYTDNFDATYGIFASYIGGEFKDEDWSEDFKVKQNGGYIGLRGNWYIGKLFINGIADYGMLQNNADNPYKTDDFNSSVIGLAARVGYNFEVSRRRFTIQPNLGLTGKYILTDDFETALKNGKDIKEEIDNVTNITIEPGLKLALNLGKCWILSGEGKYVVENFSGDTKVTGEELDFVLPDTSYKNYANLGLGIEKIWGYTVLHLKGNKTFGGRDGIIVNAGIEFKF